jgi:hypothetical protein
MQRHALGGKLDESGGTNGSFSTKRIITALMGSGSAADRFLIELL